MPGSNDLQVPPPRNRRGTADCAGDQDELKLPGGDIWCGGGRSPLRARPAAELFGYNSRPPTSHKNRPAALGLPWPNGTGWP